MNAQIKKQVNFSEHLGNIIFTHYIRAGYTIYKVTASKEFVERKPVYTLTSIEKIHAHHSETSICILDAFETTTLDIDEQKDWLKRTLLDELKAADYRNYIARKNAAEANAERRYFRAIYRNEQRNIARAEEKALLGGY